MSNGFRTPKNSFFSMYKDHVYMILTAFILGGMLLGFYDVFAKQSDIDELKKKDDKIEEKIDSNYDKIDGKLDKILYQLLEEDK